MFCLKNVTCFLNSEYGKALDEDIRSGIIQRATEVAADDDSIENEKTHHIFANAHLEQLFEQSFRNSEEQREILGDFAEKHFGIKNT